MRILIGDKDEALLELLQSYLWDQGHEAELATDGLECSIVLGEFQPDLLIVNCDFLCEDDVLVAIQEDLDLFNITVILLSNAGAHVVDPPLSPRYVGWIQKPFRLRDLLESIRSSARSERFTRVAVET